MSYKFSVSVSGCNIKESNTWANIIKYATVMAKANIGEVVKIKGAHFSESFVWSVEDNDLIPYYG